MTVTNGSSDDADDESDSSEESNSPTFVSSPTEAQRTLNDFYLDWKKEVETKKGHKRNTVNKCVRSDGSRECTLPWGDVNPPRTIDSNTSSQWTSTGKTLVKNEKDMAAVGDVTPRTSSASCQVLTDEENYVVALENDITLLSLGVAPPGKIAIPEWETAMKHISDLPIDLLLRIIRWAVGSHLDTRVLGVLAQVCHGFYFLSHDSSLWRDICLRRWQHLDLTNAVVQPTSTRPLGLHNAHTEQQQFPAITSALTQYGSWRSMAIHRPQLLFDGCYMCRISYVRTGCPDFQLTYNPVFLVVYYRGIRFHMNGQVEMLTTPSPPESLVASLGKHKHSHPVTSIQGQCAEATSSDQSQATSATAGGLLVGSYEWCDPNTVICKLHRPPNREVTNPYRRRHQPIPFAPDLAITFHIRFKVSNTKRRLHNVLQWDSYIIHTHDRASNSEYSTTIDLSEDKFPACYFSRVRSYTADVASSFL